MKPFKESHEVAKEISALESMEESRSPTSKRKRVQLDSSMPSCGVPVPSAGQKQLTVSSFGVQGSNHQKYSVNQRQDGQQIQEQLLEQDPVEVYALYHRF